jgi:hypothetical protein
MRNPLAHALSFEGSTTERSERVLREGFWHSEGQGKGGVVIPLSRARASTPVQLCLPFHGSERARH